MAANPPSNLDKAAILLRRLPPQSLTKVLEIIGVESSAILQKAISSVSKRTDLSELDEQVLQEFREMQREVKESLRGSPQLERMHNGKTTDSVSDTVQQSASLSGETDSQKNRIAEA